MNFKIFYNLIFSKNRLTASRQFKNVLWNKLDISWQEKYQVKYLWFQRPAFRWMMVSLAGIILAGGLTTGVYAYVSPEVTDDTILYPIKQMIEQVEELTKRTPEAKTIFYVKQIERREAEREVMEKKMVNLEKIDEKINKIEDKLEQADQLLEKMTTKDNQINTKVNEILEKKTERKEQRSRDQQEVLQKVKDMVEKKKEVLEEKNEKKTQNIFDGNNKIQKIKEDKEKIKDVNKLD